MPLERLYNPRSIWKLTLQYTKGGKQTGCFTGGYEKAKEYEYSPQGDRIIEMAVTRGFTLDWKVHKNSVWESNRNAY